MRSPRFRPLAALLALALSLGLALGPARMLAGASGVGPDMGRMGPMAGTHQHHDGHGGHHLPAGECCDLCGSCCASFAAPGAAPILLPVAVEPVRHAAPASTGRLASAPLHHLLPFAQAPPALLI